MCTMYKLHGSSVKARAWYRALAIDPAVEEER
jgi:hypothetical protein